MLGRANAGREWLCGGEHDESLGFAPKSAMVGRSFRRESLAMCGSASVGMRSRVTRGHVTTYRPEHVVDRAGRTPVAAGPRTRF